MYATTNPECMSKLFKELIKEYNLQTYYGEEGNLVYVTLKDGETFTLPNSYTFCKKLLNFSKQSKLNDLKQAVALYKLSRE